MSNALCQPECDDITLIGVPEICGLVPRTKTLSRVHFFPCSIDLPDVGEDGTMSEEALNVLYVNGDIVRSQPLGNFTIGEITEEGISLVSCAPDFQITTGREITVQDRIKIELSSVSPVTEDKFADYGFWADKNRYNLQLGSFWEYCDGDIIYPRNPDGSPMAFQFKATVNWDIGTNGRPWVEYKLARFTYAGDPFDLSVMRPIANYNQVMSA